MSATSLRRRVLVAALVVSAALGLALPVAGPAVAATADPDLRVTVQISQVSPSVLRPGEDLTVRATLRNDGRRREREARRRAADQPVPDQLARRGGRVGVRGHRRA